MLRVEAVSVRRGSFTLAADFAVKARSRTAVIGPSGGGKSTLLSVIAGFDVPEAGRVLMGGADVTDLLPGARPVAMLFQDSNLFPHLDLTMNVALGVEPVARPSTHARERAREALARVGLADHASKRPGELSGGQQSRAALARVLLTAKPVVLLDEPFAALGPALRREMTALVTELLPEATILMVTHDPEEARRSAGQILFVDDGRVSGPVASDAFFDAPGDAARSYLEG